MHPSCLADKPGFFETCSAHVTPALESGVRCPHELTFSLPQPEQIASMSSRLATDKKRLHEELGLIPFCILLCRPSVSLIYSRFYKLDCFFCVWCPTSNRCLHLPKSAWGLLPPGCTKFAPGLTPHNAKPGCMGQQSKDVGKTVRGRALWPHFAIMQCEQKKKKSSKGNMQIGPEQVICFGPGVSIVWTLFTWTNTQMTLSFLFSICFAATKLNECILATLATLYFLN